MDTFSFDYDVENRHLKVIRKHDVGQFFYSSIDFEDAVQVENTNVRIELMPEGIGPIRNRVTNEPIQAEDGMVFQIQIHAEFHDDNPLAPGIYDPKLKDDESCWLIDIHGPDAKSVQETLRRIYCLEAIGEYAFSWDVGMRDAIFALFDETPETLKEKKETTRKRKRGINDNRHIRVIRFEKFAKDYLLQSAFQDVVRVNDTHIEPKFISKGFRSVRNRVTAGNIVAELHDDNPLDHTPELDDLEDTLPCWICELRGPDARDVKETLRRIYCLEAISYYAVEGNNNDAQALKMRGLIGALFEELAELPEEL